jgi:hypothetical protein
MPVVVVVDVAVLAVVVGRQTGGSVGLEERVLEMLYFMAEEDAVGDTGAITSALSFSLPCSLFTFLSFLRD